MFAFFGRAKLLLSYWNSPESSKSLLKLALLTIH
jgi:hypothetical protein